MYIKCTLMTYQTSCLVCHNSWIFAVLYVHRESEKDHETVCSSCSQTEHEHSVHSSFTDWTWTQCSQQLHRLNMNTVFTAASQTEHEHSVHSSFTDWTWTVFTAASQTEASGVCRTSRVHLSPPNVEDISMHLNSSQNSKQIRMAVDNTL